MEFSRKDCMSVNNEEPADSFNTSTVKNDACSTSYRQYFIVTADDYGYGERRDRGIVECFTRGIVTRASLLVNGVSARTSAVQLAKENNLPLGIHLNLTEGEPVGDGNWSLMKSDGARFFRGKFGFRDALERHEIDMNHVKNEIIAQIEMFIQLVGSLPNHVDGHQHIHVLPRVRDVIAEVMQVYSLKQIRIPVEDYLPDWFDGNTEFFRKVFQEAKEATEIYSSCGIWFPDKFMGVCLMGKNMSVNRITQVFQRTAHEQVYSGSKFCEFMVHPGYSCVTGEGGCGNGPDNFACSPEREHEADILKDGKLKEFLHANRIRLIS